MSDNVQKELNELVKQSDLFVSSPETIERLKARGLPIKSIFITYKEYLEKLFTEKRKIADDLIGKLPILDANIANATIYALYEELKECFVLGIPGAGITLSVILLETALKYRLFEERSKKDQNSKWEDIEQIDFKRTINDLFSQKVITKEEKKELNDFNLETRNPYIHYNIKRLVKDMILQEMSSVDIETGVVTKLKNIKPSEYPSLWFSAKRVLDKKTIVLVSTFCVDWVNKILLKV